MTWPGRARARGRAGVTALGALAVGVLVPVALAACTPDDGRSPSPDAAPSAAADVLSPGPGDGTTAEDGGAGAAEDRGGSAAEPEVVRVPVGTTTVEIAVSPLPSAAPGEAAPSRVSTDDEGASDVMLALADAPALVSVEGGSLVRHADGTLTVLDDGGAPAGGFGAPRVVGPHGEPRRAGTDDGTGTDDAGGTDDRATAGTLAAGTPGVRVALVDARRAEVALVPAAGTSSGTSSAADATSSAPGATTDGAGSGGTGAEGDGPTAAWDVVVALGTQAVRSTDWGEREGGRSLAVDPTAWARAAGQAGRELVWAQVVAAEPEADTPTMHDQLVCHAVGAPDKATWNLEPWRPDVGLLATMAARCNPA
ncbi:DUF2599 domain-containing protein [Cellulosimicrobium cellulans]|uniref:DUF2599 domain-containing protein n=1 Tax=Cellulosimicrobium cellulans TaxID=1710 RepID=UPI0019646DDC|nr:DUF2599 domain-containing protein [Cellulosimicrobium cellulans]MBN0039242.1 DUF2599 domain-containing protein [Cellulosimicrobium cellulans]